MPDHALPSPGPAGAGDGAASAGWLRTSEVEGTKRIEAGGAWTVWELEKLDRACHALGAAGSIKGKILLDLEALDVLDTAGAWLLCRLRAALDQAGARTTVVNAAQGHEALLEVVRRQPPTPPPAPAHSSLLRIVSKLGHSVVQAGYKATCLLAFFGQCVVTGASLLLRPGHIRLTSLTYHLEQTCLNALPIVALIAFLLGVVMAYQGADQLSRFGAEIFTVDLLGISILREIGILLTAIVVAGRSGSAFTAEIGAMKVNQEIDALMTLGLDPIEVLVLPRLFALLIALPLLVFLADVVGLFGGGVMAWIVLDISPAQFLAQLSSAITPATFWVGMVKAPVFAFLIAMVGCYEGLNVQNSADSVGRQTTRSVVVGIFLVIVFDAMFSILFSYLGI